MQYITIQRFMVDELNLKGNDLLVYAILYGFSQDKESSYTGGLQYLADWCGATKHGIIKNLKNLTEQGLITKEEIKINGCKYTMYRVTELHGMKLSYINNKEGNNTNIISNKEDSFIGSIVTETKTKKKNKYEKCVDEINSFTDDEKLREVLVCYLKLRLEMTDSPIYVNQWKGMLNKLNQLADSVDGMIDVVQQSIDRGYRGFFEVKKKARKQGFTEAISKTTPDKEKKRKEGLDISGRKF